MILSIWNKLFQGHTQAYEERTFNRDGKINTITLKIIIFYINLAIYVILSMF